MTNEAPDFGALGPDDPRRAGEVVLVSRLRTGRVVEAMRYSDATLYDRMHARAQLSDRQHEAAERLHRMWTSARLNPRVVAGIDVVRERVEDEEPPHEQTDDDETPHDRYRRLMGSLSEAACLRLEAMLCEQHPGVRWLGSLQAALDDLADRWGMEK
ncbi:MAG TPA: hypothetical protein VN702_17500 [Acetobacteraceae bacterium]|nr:hypothetical protein [Acetobacteraceae bacterium]